MEKKKKTKSSSKKDPLAENLKRSAELREELQKLKEERNNLTNNKNN